MADRKIIPFEFCGVPDPSEFGQLARTLDIKEERLPEVLEVLSSLTEERKISFSCLKETDFEEIHDTELDISENNKNREKLNNFLEALKELFLRDPLATEVFLRNQSRVVREEIANLLADGNSASCPYLKEAVNDDIQGFVEFLGRARCTEELAHRLKEGIFGTINHEPDTIKPKSLETEKRRSDVYLSLLVSALLSDRKLGIEYANHCKITGRAKKDAQYVRMSKHIRAAYRHIFHRRELPESLLRKMANFFIKHPSHFLKFAQKQDTWNACIARAWVLKRMIGSEIPENVFKKIRPFLDNHMSSQIEKERTEQKKKSDVNKERLRESGRNQK